MKRRRFGTIGVLGGLGPEAGAYLLGRIVRETAAPKDQDHPPVILYSLPQVPDRTPAILRKGPSPVAAILRSWPNPRPPISASNPSSSCGPTT